MKKTKTLIRRTLLQDRRIDPAISRDTPALRRFGAKIHKKIETGGFDLLLVIKGNVILPETLLSIKRSYPQVIRVLWHQDSIVRYPLVLKGARYYDDVNVAEPTDLMDLRNIGVAGSVLSSCYDPTLYKPLERNGIHEYRRDLAFVAEGRNERFAFLRAMAKDLSLIRRRTSIGIFGANWESFQQDVMNSVIPGIDWEIHSANISPTEANRVYNQSRICMNIHHAQAKTGLNLRTFEIPGSQSLELVDRKSTLKEYFEEGKELIAFGPGDRLNETIASLLDDVELVERIAMKGHLRAAADHTYARRIDQLLRRL